MKSIIKIFMMLAIAGTTLLISPQKTEAQQAAVSFQLFYDQLAPYGQWVNYPSYGYVWMPKVASGFEPYATDGHWIFTDNGWTWVSDYSWGWAPFHYGRWDNDPAYGWFWVPDTQWGPAWVVWRRSPGYYGWAPLRPGVSVNVAFGADYKIPNERWIFVKDADFGRPDIYHHYVNRSNNVTIIKNSTVIVNKQENNTRNVTYITGPDRADVQKNTKRDVTQVNIQENDKPAQQYDKDKGQLKMYRQDIQRDNPNGQKASPAKVQDLKDVKPKNKNHQNDGGGGQNKSQG